MPKKLNSNNCPILETVDIISRKWIILIVVVIGNSGKLRYTEITRHLSGINPKALADALKKLESLGLISRQAFNEIPPRVEYRLTKAGDGLYNGTIPLLQWAADRTGDKDCEIVKTALSKKR